jgi:hypothetical protein
MTGLCFGSRRQCRSRLLASMMNSAFAYGDTAAITGDYAGVPVEVMGVSGLPNPLTQPGSGSNSRSGQLR